MGPAWRMKRHPERSRGIIIYPYDQNLSTEFILSEAELLEET